MTTYESVRCLAGRQGFEPRYRGPEPRVLPLDDLPVPVRRARWVRTFDYKRSKADPASARTGTGCTRSLSRNVVHGAALSSVARIAALAARFVPAAALLLLLAAMARHPALATRFTRLFARPLVRGPFLMRGFAALARNLALFAPVHRRKSTILFGHLTLLAYTSFVMRANTRAATDVPRIGCNSQQ